MFLVSDVFAMIRDIRVASRVVNAWGAALNLPQLVGGVVFAGRLEGQLVLATAIVTLVIAAQIHKRSPFSRLTGLCHLPWLALAPWLFFRLQSADGDAPFRVWGYYVVATMAISLAFDAFDVVRHVRGAKKFAWRA